MQVVQLQRPLASISRVLKMLASLLTKLDTRNGSISNTGTPMKHRNKSHQGGLILDCRHWLPFHKGATVGGLIRCRKCNENHAIMFVIEPRVLPKRDQDSNQLTIDDIPPF